MLSGLRLLAYLPLPVIGMIGYAIGALLYALGRGKVVDINLCLCFPEWTDQQRKQVARRHFMALTRSFMELAVQCWQPKSRFLNSVRIVDMQHLTDHQGKPVMILMPHFVGINAAAAISEQIPSHAMYSTNKDAALDEVLRLARQRYGNPNLISKQQGLRAIIKALKTHAPLFYLPDMDFGARDSVFVPFFGTPAATITAVSRLAKVSDAKVVPLVIRQLGLNDGYEARFYPAWENFPSGDDEADARRMNAFIEDRVREMPEQYYWVHRRFGTRPPNSKNLYK